MKILKHIAYGNQGALFFFKSRPCNLISEILIMEIGRNKSLMGLRSIESPRNDGRFCGFGIMKFRDPERPFGVPCSFRDPVLRSGSARAPLGLRSGSAPASEFHSGSAAADPEVFLNHPLSDKVGKVSLGRVTASDNIFLPEQKATYQPISQFLFLNIIILSVSCFLTFVPFSLQMVVVWR